MNMRRIALALGVLALCAAIPKVAKVRVRRGLPDMKRLNQSEFPISTPEICNDKFFNKRTQHINVINMTDALGHGRSGTCLDPKVNRIMIGNRNLASCGRPKNGVQIDDIVFTKGCILQYITVPIKTEFKVECAGRRNACVVTIPCIVPWIIIGFEFEYVSESNTTRPKGNFTAEIKASPTTVTAIVLRTDEGCSTVSRLYHDIKFPKLFHVTSQTNDHEQECISGYLRTLEYRKIFYEEVTHFVSNIIEESLTQSTGLIPLNMKLRRSCKKVVVDPACHQLGYKDEETTVANTVTTSDYDASSVTTTDASTQATSDSNLSSESATKMTGEPIILNFNANVNANATINETFLTRLIKFFKSTK